MAATLPEIEQVLAAYQTGQYASEFAESVKCTATVIEGDRYKITFSDASTDGDK